ATSVDVERVFSHGHFILSHVRSHLSAQSIHALLCLGSWSLQGYISDGDAQAVSNMPAIDEEEVLMAGWDHIDFCK
ncbi:hypothetical protein BDQ17DRAFT_1254549, partial [Cyathus striatus]